MANKRVLQVSAVDGTIRRFVSPFIDKLLADGYEVEIACSKTQISEELIGRGYTVHDVPFKRRWVSLYHPVAVFRLLFLMRKRRYDIVHVHTAVASVITRIAARLAKVPTVIYTAHGFYLRDDMNILVKSFVLAIERIMGRFATDIMFTVSSEGADLARRYKFLPDNSIIYIGNGINLDKYNREKYRKEYRASLGLKENDWVIGFVGRFVEEKGILDLVEAFNKVRFHNNNARLLLVGAAGKSERDKSLNRKLDELIAKNKLEDAIILTGYRNDVPGLLAAMDVFCLPSYREGMPISLLEAMASSLPVVATNISGSREAVLEGKTGFLVPVSNPSLLADSFEKLLKGNGLQQEFGIAGRERVEEFYDENIVLQRQLEIYHDI